MNEENKKLLLEAGVDFDRTMERFMNNEGLYLKFLKRFPEDPNFAQMKENIAGGQYEEAFKNAHTLKGLSGNLGLESFYQTISVLTEQLRNKNLDHLEESMRDAEDIYKMLIQKISRL